MRNGHLFLEGGVLKILAFPILLTLFYKAFRIGLILISIKIVVDAYQRQQISIKYALICISLIVFILLFKVLLKWYIKLVAIKNSGGVEKQIHLNIKIFNSSANYLASVLLVVLFFILFALVDRLFIVAWATGIALFFLFRLNDHPEICLVLALMSLALCYVALGVDVSESRLVSFVISVLAFRYWFSDTHRVLRSYSGAMANLKKIAIS